MLSLSVNKNSKTPIFKQIADAIFSEVLKGNILPGAALPAEREFAQTLGVSRGTVKKAYEELIRQNTVKTVRGSGTYIAVGKKIAFDAASLMEETIGILAKEFTSKEIAALFFTAVTDKKTVKIAAIDCNLESLQIFKKQLGFFEGAAIMDFLIPDMKAFKNGGQVFENFDILYTTETHFDEVASIIGTQKEKLARLVISPDRKTLLDIGALKKSLTWGSDENKQGVGIVSKSERFAEIIKNNLGYVGIEVGKKSRLLLDGLHEDSLKIFLEDKEAVIMPPLYTLGFFGGIYEDLFKFRQNGGVFIIFNYTIERGSLIYLDEKVKDLKTKKEAGG